MFVLKVPVASNAAAFFPSPGTRCEGNKAIALEANVPETWKIYIKNKFYWMKTYNELVISW